MVGLKQTLLKVKSKTTVDVKYSRKEHSARVSSLLRVYEQYERQLEGQVREATNSVRLPASDDAPCMQELAATCFLQDAGLIGRDWVFGRPVFLGKTPPIHAAEPRDCPCRPRAPQRAGVRVRVRVRVDANLGSSWSGST